MSDDSFEPYAPDGYSDPAPASRLPGGVSMQTAAAVLLIAVVLATLYLFFGPLPDDGATAPPTPTAALARATAATTPATGTVGAGGLSAATASPATLAGSATVAVGLPTAATPSLLGASADATPLPAGSLAAGAFVTVVGVGSDGLRYRMGAGQDYLTIRIVDEGETLKVLGGPEVEGATTFWRLQDALGNVGWAAEPFLAPAAAPAGWNPPVASPTFAAGLDAAGGAGASAP